MITSSVYYRDLSILLFLVTDNVTVYKAIFLKLH